MNKEGNPDVVGVFGGAGLVLLLIGGGSAIGHYTEWFWGLIAVAGALLVISLCAGIAELRK